MKKTYIPVGKTYIQCYQAIVILNFTNIFKFQKNSLNTNELRGTLNFLTEYIKKLVFSPKKL